MRPILRYPRFHGEDSAVHPRAWSLRLAQLAYSITSLHPLRIKPPRLGCFSGLLCRFRNLGRRLQDFARQIFAWVMLFFSARPFLDLSRRGIFVIVIGASKMLATADVPFVPRQCNTTGLNEMLHSRGALSICRSSSLPAFALSLPIRRRIARPRCNGFCILGFVQLFLASPLGSV